MSDLDLAALDLTIDDRDPQAIFDAAAQSLVGAGFALRNGSIEVALLEAIATADADVIYAVNRIIGLTVEAILKLYDVERSPGTQATGSVLLTLDGPQTLTVDAGVELSLPDADLEIIVTETTSGVAMESLTLPVRTVDSVATVNWLAAGAVVDLVDDIPYVVSAETTGTFSGGTAPESDDAFLARARNRLARVTSSLVIPDHFTAYCLEDVRVARAAAIDEWDESDTGDPGDHPGFITLAVYGFGGQVASEVQAELLAAMRALTVSHLTVRIMDSVITTVNVEADVKLLPGYDSDAVRAEIESAIAAWLSPATWEYDSDVRVLSLGAVIAAVEGVDYVDAIDAPVADVELTGPGGLAQAGTVDVTFV